MPRKKANIHYLYKTTCLITGRYYIGMHSTTNLEDGYMGSGKRLRYSIRKYGKENHTKEILEFFDSRELLVEAEKQAITSEMVLNGMCMNLCFGGNGGYISPEGVKKGRKKTDSILKQKYGENFKSIIAKNYYDNLSPNERIKLTEKIKNGRAISPNQPKSFLGKHHSDKAKKLIGLNSSNNQSGQKNSQYGTMWISNGVENKKIKKEDNIPEGWYKGRKIL